jgi:hypothetical protein
MKTLRILKFAGFGILGLGFIALFILITMSLWNCLIPTLFHGPVLTYWQTAGIFLLSKILLTGIAPHGHDKRPGFRRFDKNWKEKYYHKYGSECPEADKPVTSEQV